MKRVALKFPRWAKATLYGNLLLSLATGSTWFVLHRWFQFEGEFGPEKSPLEPLLMKVHGASAFFALISFGYLLASHVPVGWKSSRNRRLGVTLVTYFGMLAVSGYLLYYASSDSLRSVTGWVHLGLGLTLPIILGCHVWRGHRKRS